MIIELPFGSTIATITGTYYPAVPARMYNSDGSPGDPPEYADFDIETFEVGGEDILEQLSIMQVLRANGKYEDYLDTILDIVLEKAYTQHRDDFEEHCGNGYYSKWH